MNPTELAEAERDRRRARWLFIGWLALSTMLTIGGNLVDAYLGAIDPGVIRSGVRVIPPIQLAIGIAGLMALSSAGMVHRAKRGGWAAVKNAGKFYQFSVVSIFLLVAVTLVLSWAGLLDVAIAGGTKPSLAPLWPISIDAGVVVSTVALAALRPASAADLRAAREVAREAEAARKTTVNREVVEQLVQRVTPPRTSPPPAPPPPPVTPAPVTPAPVTPAPSPPPPPPPPAPVTPAPMISTPPAVSPSSTSTTSRARAEAIAARADMATPIETIEQVLDRLDAGVSQAAIARELGVHAKTVSKISKHDAPTAPRLLASVR
ncbi:DUF2637 domain-containing protein [Mycobacterium sp. M1]|uniref:DUF2637 domain-containing protein n=1 Tax=Mycolicibacter acidiphilus TaxID=2835306 RepID=A0ABS5RG40_9MYCO|nr:DUF2637 domain-containing protein [Mycolicibacter acidiphilus]MBS9532614.1 DUF2637 domain-containing protein [Mycolicibacter acidiphilus]